MKDDSVAKKHDESEDDRWLAQIRSNPVSRGGKPLDPDPWLDGPQPGTYPDPFGSPAAPDPFNDQEDPPGDAGTPRPAGWDDRPGDASRHGVDGRWQPRPPAGAPAPMPTYRPPDEPAPMPNVRQHGDPEPMPNVAGDAGDGREGPPSADRPSSRGLVEPPREAAPGASAPPEPASDPWAPGYDIPRLAGDGTDHAPAERERRQAPEDGAAAWQAPPSPPAHEVPPSHHVPPPAHQTPPAPPSPPARQAPPAYQPPPGAQHGYSAPPTPPSTAGAPLPADVPPAQLGGLVQAPAIVPLDLDHTALVKQRKEAPQHGWRRAIYKASFGGINPGISRERSEKNALVERIRTPIRGCHKIAVVSLKGGIGKTTTTSCLGLTLAHYRGDRVVALDANPDAGTLAERLTGVTDVSVRDLLENLEQIQSFTDISRYMSLASRLQVLASDQDAEVSEAFDAEQYTRVTALLARYYNVILTDSGTGMLHSAMRGTLEAADSLVVVGAPSVDGSSRAAKTLDWLVAHGYGHLVSSAVAVISSVRERSNSVDMEVLRNHFGARCRAVIEIPYDQHLVIGGRIDMTQIRPQTERAYLELAAAVADGFGQQR